MAENGDPGQVERVRFLYNQAPDYRIAAANGALGGPTSQGDYLIEFYCERPQTAIVQEHSVDAEGKLGPVERGPDEARVPQIERYVQFAVLMSPEKARDLAQWIRQRLEAIGKWE